ncbi:amidase [Pseudarthrobacter sp. SSS035]|uniref:amidase n=1 Tax=Pseudarthrobacter sp. SSS035 TaxID=2931399 RepID=UPI00200BBE22|nr:amidase [Pseudarthrobacter sp. SSS035]
MSAVEHVEQVLTAIETSQSEFGSWAYVDHASATAAALSADKARAAGGPLGPLHGVAVGIKDVIPVAGMPLRAGSAATDDTPSREDAAAVRQLRNAGAVIVGKTTTHEFASGQGDPGTRNPRHGDRHPGGSSVGSAVAVALGTVGATLGTDTTGSIRNPSAANKVVGFKPSRGVVRTDGLLYFSDTLDSIGPIAPTVNDCRLLLSALTGKTGAAPEPGRRFTVAVVRGTVESALVHPGFREVFEGALERLKDSGIELVECQAPAYAQGMTAALILSLIEGARHHEARLTNRAADYLPETRRLIEAGLLLDFVDEELARRTAIRLRAQLKDLAVESGADALVSLTLPAPQSLLSSAVTYLTAPPSEGSLSAGIQHLSLANVTGAAAITVPAGESDGHPVGLHLLGLRGGDDDLLQLAMKVEASLMNLGGPLPRAALVSPE